MFVLFFNIKIFTVSQLKYLQQQKKSLKFETNSDPVKEDKEGYVMYTEHNRR